MGKAMKAMKKAMKARKAGGAMTKTGVFQSAAETTGLKTKDVKSAVDAWMGVAAEQVKKSGSFKLGGMLNMKLKQAGNEGTQGHQPFHQGALRFQGEACLEDRTLPCPEEAQGDALRRVQAQVMVGRAGFVLAAGRHGT